jgi:hypothetical protein
VTHKSELGKSVVDRLLDTAEGKVPQNDAASLASNTDFQAAQKTREADSHAWGFANLNAVREAGGAKKALGLCATNAAIVEMAHGPYIEAWPGKQITLRTAVCKGEDCIRLDVPAGKKVPRRYPRFSYSDTKAAPVAAQE